MKKYFISSLLIVFGLLFVSTGHSMEPAGASIDILNGVTLDDFDYYLNDNGKKEDVFNIRSDGVLELTGNPFGWLAPKKVKPLKNLTFSAEYSFPNPDIQTNSGLLFRITRQGTTFLPACIEVQLKKGETADLYSFQDYIIHGDKNRWLSGKNHVTAGNYCKVGLFRDAEKKEPKAWNKIEVTCFESIMIIKINDQIVNWAWDVENVAGRIAFQAEGGPILFKNAVLTPLK